MNIRIIPKDEVKQDRYNDKSIVKELIEKVRKRRKYYAKYNSECQKKKADCRNSNLDPNSSHGIGYITEALVAKKLGFKTCFDVTGNFNYQGYDIFENKDWGKINVKGSMLASGKNLSAYHTFHTNRNKKPNFFFCVGYDHDMKHVTTVYIIPNDDYVRTLSSIRIPYDSNSNWDIFEESKDEIYKWNNLFHTLKLKNCPVLRKNKE